MTQIHRCFVWSIVLSWSFMTSLGTTSAETPAEVSRSYNSVTRSLPGGRLQTEIHGKWIHYLDSAGRWQPIRSSFVEQPYGFEMTAAPFGVVAPRYADEAATFCNDNRFDATTGTVIDEAPLEQSIQALGTAHVQGLLETGDFGWGPSQYVVYPDAYSQYGADLIYWVHEGNVPRLRKFIRFNRPLTADTDFDFLVEYGEPVETVRHAQNVTVRRAGGDRRGSGWASFYIWDSGRGWSGRRSIRFTFEPEGEAGPLPKRERELYRLTKHIEAAFFEDAVLPVFTDATATLYPDPNTESTSVDGTTFTGSYCGGSSSDVGIAWSDIITRPGTTSYDSSTTLGVNLDACLNPTWRGLSRAILLFDTAAIPDNVTVSSATLALYGSSKSSNIGGSVSFGIVSSNPASNTALTASDHSTLGSTLLSSTLTWNDWLTSGYNGFTLNAAGLAQISKTGVTKLGLRCENDRTGSNPPHPGGGQSAMDLSAYSADQAGTAQDPVLIVTYCEPPTVSAIDPASGTNDAAANITSVTGTGFAGVSNTHAVDLERDSGQYFTAADSPSLSVTGDMTIEGWVRFESDVSMTVAYKWNTGAGQGGYIAEFSFTPIAAARLNISSNGSNSSQAEVPWNPETGRWYHVAFVYRAAAGLFEFLVNGKSLGTAGGLLAGIFDSSAGLAVGANSGGGNYVDGLLDDVRIWSVARTAAEIRADMQQELPGGVSGLRASWNLDNDALDSSGNENHLTAVSGPSYTTDAAFMPRSGDLEKDSTQHLATVPVGLPTGNAPRTIEAWIRPESLPTAGREATIFDYGTANTSEEFQLGMVESGGNYYSALDVHGAFYGGSVNLGFSAGMWSHYAVTYDGTTARYYIDGVFKNSVTPGALNTGSTYARIGDRFNNANTYDGLVDEVRVWNVERSASEISDNRSITLCSQPFNLVAYWKLDNNYVDSTSNGNTLSPVGGPVFSTNVAISSEPTLTLSKSGETDIGCTGFTRVDAMTLTNGVCDITGAALGLWDVTVTNPDGESGTLSAGFEVVSPCDPATIDVDPAGATYCEGDTATHEVTASGTEPLAYQWRKDGFDLTDDSRISGSSTGILTIDPIEAGDAGDYTVVVSNACGTAESGAATIEVLGGPDCNTNGTPDECDIYNGDSDDCNGNGAADECDLAGGTSDDCTMDGVPDECEEALETRVWIGPNDGDWGTSSNWSPFGDPHFFRHAVLSNAGSEDNRCIANGGGVARSMLIEGPGSGRQILRLCCNSDANLTACLGITVEAGGLLELRGGQVLGGVVSSGGEGIEGYGEILAPVENYTRVVARPILGTVLRIAGESVSNYAGAALQARIGSLFLVESPSVLQEGALDIPAFSGMVFEHPLVNASGGLITLLGGALDADGVTNETGAQIDATGTIDANLTNDGIVTVIADLLIAGDLNNSGTVFIQNGIMTVTGDLNNSGAIFGGVGGRGGAPVGLTLFGDFDSAISDAGHFDLTRATVQVHGAAAEGPQHFEVLAADVGPRVRLPDSSLFSIDTLRIGPSPTTVKLVDRRDNTPASANRVRPSADREALYVRHLVLEQGVTLDVAGLRIYYGDVAPRNPMVGRVGLSVVESVGGGGLFRIDGDPGNGH